MPMKQSSALFNHKALLSRTCGDTKRGGIGRSQDLEDIAIVREIFEIILPCLKSNSQIRIGVLIGLDEIVICTFEPV